MNLGFRELVGKGGHLLGICGRLARPAPALSPARQDDVPSAIRPQ
jgi:hypothetical protein